MSANTFNVISGRVPVDITDKNMKATVSIKEPTNDSKTEQR